MYKNNSESNINQGFVPQKDTNELKNRKKKEGKDVKVSGREKLTRPDYLLRLL